MGSKKIFGIALCLGLVSNIMANDSEKTEEELFNQKLNTIVEALEKNSKEPRGNYGDQGNTIKIEVESKYTKEKKDTEEKIELLRVQKELQRLQNEDQNLREASVVGSFTIASKDKGVLADYIYTVDGQSGSKQLDSKVTNDRIKAMTKNFVVYGYGADNNGKEIIARIPHKRTTITTGADGSVDVSAPETQVVSGNLGQPN